MGAIPMSQGPRAPAQPRSRVADKAARLINRQLHPLCMQKIYPHPLPSVTGGVGVWRLSLVKITLVLGVLVSSVFVGLGPTDAPPHPVPAIEVPSGFTVEVVSTGFSLPSALEFGQGGGFGTDLYVGDWDDDAIYRVDVSAGTRTLFASGLPDPGAIMFGPDGSFSEDLYATTNAYKIVTVDLSGTPSPFAAVSTPFPRDLDFDLSGAFRGDLYIMDTGGAVCCPVGDKVLEATPSGSVSIFAANPVIPQENMWGLVFGEGAFGHDIYITYGRSAPTPGIPSIWRIESSGVASQFVAPPEFEETTDIVVSTSGPFGEFLYVADVYYDRIYRVTPDGVVEPFASGFQFNRQISSDLAFGPDGALYIAEDLTGSILRIRPKLAPPSPANVDCDPDTINIRSEGRWITCYLEPESDRNASEIVGATVRLDSWLAPVIDDKYGFSFDPNGYLVDHDQDGVTERLLKFDRQLLAERLTPGEHIFLVQGEYADAGTFSVNSEAIRVIP